MKWNPAPPLEFEINGKTYQVPPIGERSEREYIDWQAILTGKKPAPSSEDERPLLLGDAYEQMVADGVPGGAIQRAMLAVFTDFRLGRELAEKSWEAGVSPELLAPNGAETSTNTGAETSTPTPASTSGTTSPKASTKAKRKASRS